MPAESKKQQDENRSGAAKSGGRQPNVILIMADQLRADALGCMGNPIVKTPGMDRLATQGVSFERAFTNCPVCMASRAAIHTGRYPSTLDMRSMGVLLPDEITLAEKLQREGYRTGLFGKLHFLPMGYTLDVMDTDYEQDDVTPFLEPCGVLSSATKAAAADRFKKNYGFQVSYGVGDLTWGHHLDWLQEKAPEYVIHQESENWHGGRMGRSGVKYGASPPAERLFQPHVSDFFDSHVPAELHASYFIVQRAIEFVRENKDRPFFAHVSFVDPHHPFNAPIGFKEMYRPDEMPTPPRYDVPKCFPEGLPSGVDKVIKKRLSYPDELFRWALADYYGMVSNLDAAINRLVDELERLGVLEDTLIVVTSDHGEHVGDHRMMYKGSQVFDGLMRVPLIYAWGRNLPAGERRDAMVEEVDIYPTILSLLGMSSNPGVQGTDRSALLRGETQSGRERVLCELDDLPDSQYAATYALRTGKWKLIYYPNVQTGMLFDLENDPKEYTNRFFDPACVDVRHKMMQELIDEMAAQKDPLPIRLTQA